jgi:hypothetical protein
MFLIFSPEQLDWLARFTLAFVLIVMALEISLTRRARSAMLTALTRPLAQVSWKPVVLLLDYLHADRPHRR